MSFPPITAISAGDFGRASWANAVEAALYSLAYAEFPLGGSSEVSVPGTTQVAAYEQRGFSTKHSQYTDDFVWTVIVSMVVLSGGSINAELKDDLGNSIHVFTAHTSTSRAEQSYTLTPTPARTYLLYFTKANDTAEGFGHGKVVRSAVAL